MKQRATVAASYPNQPSESVNELPFSFPIWDLKRIATQPKQPWGSIYVRLSLITKKTKSYIYIFPGSKVPGNTSENATGHSPWYVKPSKWTPAPGRPSASETPNGMSTNSFLRWGVDCGSLDVEKHISIPVCETFAIESNTQFCVPILHSNTQFWKKCFLPILHPVSNVE